MKRCHYIGLDAHCQFTEMAVVNARGEVVQRGRCPTTIPALTELLGTAPRPCAVALEEGPLADWLWRHLAPRVEQFTVCDPRRNGLIAKDSDKDDPIDAAKLAHLLCGGYLKAVHHPAAQGRAVAARAAGGRPPGGAVAELRPGRRAGRAVAAAADPGGG